MPDREAQTIHLSWPRIIAEEHRRHPAMTGGDLYKLIAQACLGGDHLLRDKERFGPSFLGEWASLRPGEAPHESALQIIHPAGKVARLHLLPCQARGIAGEDLLELLLVQPLRNGRMEALAWSWASVLHSARCAEIPFDYRSLVALTAPNDVPHHSADYGPASYRIINDLRHPSTRSALADLGLL